MGVALFESAEKRNATALDIGRSVDTALDVSDRPAFDAAFGKLTTARGNESLLGYERGALGPAFYGRVSIADRKAESQALTDLVSLSGKPSVDDALKKRGLRISAKETVLERIGDVVCVRIGAASEDKTKDPPSPSSHPPKAIEDGAPGLVNLYLRNVEGGLAIGSGIDGEAALHEILDGPTLESEAHIGSLLASLPKDGHLAFFADPSRLAHGPSAPRSLAVAVLTHGGATIGANASAVQALAGFVAP
jgi:hypothetical protein